MPTNFWTIDNDPPPNPGVGNALNGLQIQPVYTGTPPALSGYNLMNGSNVLASTTSTTMPITFSSFPFAHRTWDISATLSLGVNGSGTWSIIAGLSEEDSGDNGEFQAQAGTGVEEDGDAASSAYA